MAEDAATIPSVDIDVLTDNRNAPHLEAILFADYAATGADGKATVAGIFDRVFVNPETKASGRFFVYIKTAETFEAPIEIKIIDPKNRVVATANAEVDQASLAKMDSPRSVSLFLAFSLQLTPEGVEGLYWFEVSYKERSLGGASLKVEVKKEE